MPKIMEADPSQTNYVAWTIDENGTLMIRDSDVGRELSFSQAEKIGVKRIDVDVTEFPVKKNLFADFVNVRSASIKADKVNGTTLEGFFRNCENLQTIDAFDLDTGKIEYMSGMFEGCHSLKSIDLSKLKTGSCKYFDHVFKGCASLESLDVSNFDTSKAENVSAMFACFKRLEDDSTVSSLKSIKLGNLNLSNITDASSMFQDCSELESLDLSGVTTSKLTNVRAMLNGCSGLKSLDLSGLDFGTVTNAIGFWFEATSLTSVKTPKNVTVDVKLPVGEGNWVIADTGEKVTSLPKALAKSVELKWVKEGGEPADILRAYRA